MRVVVFGATGFIGRALLPALAAEQEVVAVSRSRQPPQKGVTWVVADVTDAPAVRRALEARTSSTTSFIRSALRTSRSETWPGRGRRPPRLRPPAPARSSTWGLGEEGEELSPHLRSRLETGRALASGAVPLTTLRAAVVVGKGSAAFETIVALVDRLPVMVAPRWVSTPTQPIALADTVRYLAAVAGREETIGESYDLGGPEVMTYRQMIERVAGIRGKQRVIIEVPVLTPFLSSLWLHLVTPVGASVARPLIEGLRNPTVAEDTRIRDLVPFPLTPFDRAAREALGMVGR